jgi:hypothetical protein
MGGVGSELQRAEPLGEWQMAYSRSTGEAYHFRHTQVWRPGRWTPALAEIYGCGWR